MLQMVWSLSTNGIHVDVRRLLRKVKGEAVQRRMIPYIPGEKGDKEAPTFHSLAGDPLLE
jgi:hypothetical protein